MRRDDEHETQAFLRAVVAELKREAPADPFLAARVLAEARRPAPTRVLRWLVRPRPIRVAPLGLIAMAAAIVALVVVPRTRPGQPEVTGPAIQFTLFAPSAAEVALVGDFNDWDPRATRLTPSRRRAGLWTVEVPLAPGRHEYAFVVDGSRWTADPAMPVSTSDEFGSPNSTLIVTGS